MTVARFMSANASLFQESLIKPSASASSFLDTAIRAASITVSTPMQADEPLLALFSLSSLHRLEVFFADQIPLRQSRKWSSAAARLQS